LSDQVESKKDLGDDPAAIATRWHRELELSSRHEARWRKSADKVIELYRDDKSGDEDKASYRFNILFANTETIQGAVFAKMPNPDVRRRFLDRDPLGRAVAQVLQRALSYTNDAYGTEACLQAAVQDMVLPGRGVAIVEYKPTLNKTRSEASEGDDGAQKADDGSFYLETEELVDEQVCERYIEWDLFRFSPAKQWSKVRWIAYGELLTRDELVDQFGDLGQKVTLNVLPKGMADTDENQIFKRALVWTIWNKPDRTVYAIAEGFKESPLKTTPDPLNLEQFFPCPKPLYMIETTNSLVPRPHYAIYQEHAIELDSINERIGVLRDALRRRGVYDSTFKELANLAHAGDNDFIGVEDFARLVEKGGLERVFMELDVSKLAAILLQLYEAADRKKQDIYEIIGISDIMRGATKANETLGAQQLKSQYGTIRIGTGQRRVQTFIRDLMRLKAEIIAEHFAVPSLAQMSGVELPMNSLEKQGGTKKDGSPWPMTTPTWEDVKAVLSSDKLRGYKIDIETDATLIPDAAEEQRNRIELLTATTSFLEKSMPAVQAGMMPQKIATEMLMFGVRSFKVGPQLEEVLDEWAQMNQQEGDPRVIALQNQIKQMQAQQQAEEMDAREAKMLNDNTGAKLEAQSKLLDARNIQQGVMEYLQQFAGRMGDVEGRVTKLTGPMNSQPTALTAAPVQDNTERILGAVMELMQRNSENTQQVLQANQQQLELFATNIQNLAQAVTAPKVKTPVRDEQGFIKSVEERTIQ